MWYNRPKIDTSIYDWKLFRSVEGAIGKIYLCLKTNKMVFSEKLPKVDGNKIYVCIADEWKEDKTFEMRELLESNNRILDILDE